MRKVLAVALCASLGAPVPGPADARTVYDEAWAWCIGADNATAAHRVEGCTWLIRHGDQKGRDLALAFINLGQARHDQADPGVALASYEQAIRLDPQGPPRARRATPAAAPCGASRATATARWRTGAGSSTWSPARAPPTTHAG